MIDFYPLGTPAPYTDKVLIKVRNGQVAIDTNHAKLLRGKILTFRDLQLLTDNMLDDLVTVQRASLRNRRVIAPEGIKILQCPRCDIE